MTTSATPTLAPPTAKRLYRAAGLGGVGAFAAWLLQPFFVLIVSPGRETPEYPVWETIASHPYDGALQVVTFAGIGTGLLFLVLGTDALVRQAGGGQSAAYRVGATLGIVAGSAWFVVAGLVLVPYTSIGTGIPDLSSDESLQAIMLDLPALIVGGVLLGFVLAGAGWIVCVITAVRRAGVIGIPLAVVGGVSLIGPVLVLALPFSPPWGSIGVLGFALVLGIAFLFKSRKA